MMTEFELTRDIKIHSYDPLCFLGAMFGRVILFLFTFQGSLCQSNFVFRVFPTIDHDGSHKSSDVNAQVSIYIPGFEPQPVSADVVGVGMDCRTTWALHKGSYPTVNGVSSMTYPDFIGTGKHASIPSRSGPKIYFTEALPCSEINILAATLVEGSQDASLTYENSIARFTIGQACTFAETFAVCTVIRDGSTAIQTEYMSAIPIQGASQDITMASRNPSTITSSFPPSPSLSQGSSPIPPTSSQSQAPTSTSSRSSNHTMTPHTLYFILGLQIVSLLLTTLCSTV